LTKQMNSANRKKKLFEVEQELRSQGWFTFHRGNLHGLFHVMAFNDHSLRLIQVQRLHKWNFNDVNAELSKVQEFVMYEAYPENAVIELWIWLNHKGWVKYVFRQDGQFKKYEDCGAHHFRKKKNVEKF
jgi:hypothetical protein